MLKFIKAPEVESHDSYDRARFKLTWNIHLLSLVIFVVLGTISIWAQPKYAVYYFVSFALVFFSVFYLKLRKKFFVAALILSITLYGIVVQSMLSDDGYLHVMDPYWLFTIMLYIYFIAGKVMGRIFIIANVTFTTLFFFQGLNNSVEILLDIDFKTMLITSIEFATCTILTGYIIHQFIDTRRAAEEDMRRVNLALGKEKEVVESQNYEKTILLQEIHHRVKNNLQVITSLLRMQSDQVQSTEAKEHFQDAINRILTMSLIHEKIYQNENLSRIDPEDYVKSLVDDFLMSNFAEGEIVRNINVEPAQIGVKTMLPVALIITELMSNSVKHAFDNTGNPKITIRIMDEEPGRYEMYYADNGTWKVGTEKSFGIQLIDTFTEQLEGNYTFTTENGLSEYEFHFVNLDDK